MGGGGVIIWIVTDPPLLAIYELFLVSAYRTVAGVNGPLVILDQVKVSHDY